MSKIEKNERKPLNQLARATYHQAPDVSSAMRDTWINVPVPEGTTRVHAHVEGEAFAAGTKLQPLRVFGVKEPVLHASVKIGGVRASHVGVWAWSDEA